MLVDVVFEQIGISTPVDRRVELLAGLLLAEAFVENVEHEVVLQTSVLGKAERLVDVLDQRGTLQSLLSEDNPSFIDLGIGEASPNLGQRGVSLAHHREIQQNCRVQDRQQV